MQQVHPGKVARVTAEWVFVELGELGRGVVPLIEYASQPLPKDGDDIRVIIEGKDEQSGLLALSKRQADEFSFWQAVQPGDVLEGVITGMNKCGLDVDIGGARAFLPASQVDSRRLHDISVLIGEHVRCVVTQVDRTTRDLIVSRRKILDREKKEKRAELLNALVEGEVRTGTVSNITEFGAFLHLGGVDGLLHITDMSWGRLKHPTEAVQLGQEIEVKVLKVDRKAGKISLGLKQLKPNPWDTAAERYQEGSRVKGKVISLADFGAFVELEEGLEALIPLSEMSWSRRIGKASELLQVDQEVEAVVLKVDPGKHRISLGLKQTEQNPWELVETRFPIDSTVKGKVSRHMEYGAFEEIAPGIEGLIHISELSAQRVRAVADVVKEQQEVEVRVIKIDREAQRISLSMRPPPKQRDADAPAEASGKPAKKRTRPLRGGLASHFEW